MDKETYIQKLEELDACQEAIDYSAQYETAQQAWDKCKHGDWMLWLIFKTTNMDDESALRKFTLAKARCAKLVLHLMKDERSRNALEVAEKFGLNQATRKELDDAASAASAASAAAEAEADAAAASADAEAAADAAYAASAAYKDTLYKCASIVCKLYSINPVCDNE